MRQPLGRTTLRSRKKQAGLGLIELSIAAAVLSVIVFYATIEFISNAEIKKAKAQGEIMRSLALSLDEYINAVAPQLVAANPAGNPVGVIDGVNVTLFNPSFDSLRALGLLDAAARNINLYGGTYLFHARKLDPACNPNIDVVCKIEGFVALSGSVSGFSGRPDYSLAGEVALAAGDAGVTGLADLGRNPETIYGPEGLWEVRHPGANGTPATVAASVALRTNTGVGALTQYLRRDGTSFMSGALQMRDITQPEAAAPRQNIIGANNIDAANLITTQDVTVGRNLAVTGNLTTNGALNTASANIAGALSAADLNVTNDAVVQDDLLVNGDGNIAGNMSVADLYIASKGQWLSQLVSDFVVVETRVLDLSVANGGLVTKPACAQKSTNVAGTNRVGPVGIPLIYATPIRGFVGSLTEVQATVVAGQGGAADQVIIDNSRLAVGEINISAQDLGTQWNIVSQAFSEPNGTTYANTFSVLAQIVCKYN